MLIWIVIAVSVAGVVFALGIVQRKRTGKSPGWANPLAAIGLTLSTVGGVLFEGIESIYMWAGGLALFFIGFFIDRIGEIQREMKQTRDIEY